MTKRTRIWIVLAAGTLGAVLFVFSTDAAVRVVNRFSGSFLFGVLEPIQSGSRSVRSTVEGIFSGPAYRAQAVALQEKIDQLTYDLAQARAVQSENEELRSMLEFTKENARPKAFAKVFRTGSLFANDFLVNRGSRDGLSAGDFVVNQGGALLGRIEEVHETTASVMVITDPRFRVIAQVQTDRHPQGLVEGSYGTSVQLRFIPQGEGIKAEDTVVASPSATLSAIAFPIGTIRRVETSSRDLFQEAVVEPFVRFNDIDLVMIYEASGN